MVFLYIFIYLVKLNVCVRNSLSFRAALWYAVVSYCKNFIVTCNHELEGGGGRSCINVRDKEFRVKLNAVGLINFRIKIYCYMR